MTRSLRALLVTAALTATGLFGTAVVSAPAAQAATSAYSCFTWGDTGTVYNTQPVHLYRWNGSSWTFVKSGKTNSGGCATFLGLTSSQNYAVRASVVLGNSSIGTRTYDGWAPITTTPGTGQANLGRGVARYLGCLPGYNGTCW